ncbi:ferritin family protein [Desulfogranum marinum]|uniref:ferritin family protein n=1 Tax=Desulfogranum marinum TaxID=453220 RepID=UPI0029C661C6|nr:ferritin family protein [Desulfogranum marinum]
MFTDVDIRNIAVQIERNGEETYRAAAKETADKNIADLLLWMADEEKRHLLWFEALELKKCNKTEEQEKMEAMGRGLLEEMVKSRTFSLEQKSLSSAEQLSSVLAQCREFEEDTVMFYEFLRGFLDDEKASKHLDIIISEEQGHVKQLENLLKTLPSEGEKTHV